MALSIATLSGHELGEYVLAGSGKPRLEIDPGFQRVEPVSIGSALVKVLRIYGFGSSAWLSSSLVTNLPYSKRQT